MCFLIILSKTFSFVLEKEIFSISILSYVLKEKTWFLQSFLFHVSISSMFFFVFILFFFKDGLLFRSWNIFIMASMKSLLNMTPGASHNFCCLFFCVGHTFLFLCMSHKFLLKSRYFR